MLKLLFDLNVTLSIVAALATSFALMLAMMPTLIRWLKRKKFGETGAKNQGAAVVDAMREGKKGTPTMGGLGIVLCILVTMALWCDLAAPRTWLLMFGTGNFSSVSGRV